MNPNKQSWQDRARMLLNPMIDSKKAYELKQSLMLVNIAPGQITEDDYKLLQKVTQ